MRLVKAVERLEASAAARAKATPRPIGICWSSQKRTVDGAQLEPGEWIATDLMLEDDEGVTIMQITERVTRDEADIGIVRNGDGQVIGRVLSVDPTLLRYERQAPEGEGMVSVDVVRGSAGEE